MDTHKITIQFKNASLWDGTSKEVYEASNYELQEDYLYIKIKKTGEIVFVPTQNNVRTISIFKVNKND